MDPNKSSDGKLAVNGRPGAPVSEVMSSLIAIAMSTTTAQLEQFAHRLGDAMLKRSETNVESKEASLYFNSGNLLKKNGYAFHYLAAPTLKAALQREARVLLAPTPSRHEKADEILTLVPFEEMDKKLMLGNAGRILDNEHASLLSALGLRLAVLLNCGELSLSQNPFRPEIFVSAISEAWCEFNPDPESHPLILPLLQPDVFLDLSVVLQDLNDKLIGCGFLPELDDSYRIKKTNANQEKTQQQELTPEEAAAEAPIVRQLRQLFSPRKGRGGSAGSTDLPENMLQAAAVSSQLLGYLANLQKRGADHHDDDDFSSAPRMASLLSSIKKQAPQGTLTQVDENTIDLLTKVFDVVFRDSNIPPEIKALIGFLQVPVLKAALVDKEFFFKEEHPARRLIEVLSKSSLGWDQTKGKSDPLFQTIKRTVNRVQTDFDQQVSVFSDVVGDLESFIKEEEAVATAALSAPITKALKQEKMVQATKVAKTEVAIRIGTGEVVAFVETFLENKWVPVLALAYSVKDEKPEAVESAVKLMDDLVWSVKPKATLEQRKELIAKLPGMLSLLNKWLNLVKLDDAERLQFFAELAECHASIVRAPLDISPQRQLEISIQVAKEAAERRQRRLAKAEPEPVLDESATNVQKLERGTWFEFAQKNGGSKKVKLAWVSPLRSLFIFSTRDKLESFSLSAEELAQIFRDRRAHPLWLGGLVGTALAEALESVGANDPSMDSWSAA